MSTADEVRERARETPSGAPASPRFSIAARVRSFGYAARGIAELLATQHNAWIHALATALVVGLGALLGVSAREWCDLVLAITLVWVAEGLNTAVEILADVVDPSHNPAIGKVKDVAAGAVLIAAIGAAVVGCVILGPPLLARISG